MFCTSCGKSIPEGSQFCPECGARVEVADVEGNFGGQPYSANVHGANAGQQDRYDSSGNRGQQYGHMNAANTVRQGGHSNGPDRGRQGSCNDAVNAGRQGIYNDAANAGQQGRYGNTGNSSQQGIYVDYDDRTQTSYYTGEKSYEDASATFYGKAGGAAPEWGTPENYGREHNRGGAGNRNSGGGGKGKTIIIIVLLAIIAVLLGLVLFTMFGDKDDEEGTAEKGQKTETSQEAQTDPPETGKPGSGQEPDVTESGGNEAVTGQEPSDKEDKKTDDSYESLSETVRESGAASGNFLELVTTDVSEYPNVKVYYRLEDSYGETVILDSPTARVTESVEGGQQIERKIRSIERLDGNEGLGMDIVIDKSSSMESDFAQVQTILNDFIRSMDYESGDAAEIIAFDSYIMYMCSYTDQMDNLLNGIDNMSTYGMTALYDALWTGVTNAGRRTGANCVIGFTDGMDNESTHTYDEVISLANSLEIPIYLIGTSGADYSVLNNISESTGGRSWDINSIQDMNDILSEIYKVQKNMYCIEYESDAKADAYTTRTVSAVLVDSAVQTGGIAEGITFTPARRAEKTAHSSRYELIKKDISWTDANDECLAKGGHLATITSQDEMDKITAMAEKNGVKFVWIGGYTSVRDNSVYGHWLTGEPFNFTAWHPGEPSRNDKLDGEPEFYLMLWNVSEDGTWTWNDQRNDVLNIGLDYFTGNLGYVCEYED